jgi:ribosomal protein S18 acetylase RimI-like enzyme
MDIARAEPAFALDQLSPLYCELHAHQLAGSPRLAHLAARAATEAWARRKDHYREWLAQNGSFLLTATVDQELAGYALVTVGAGYDGWCSAEHVGEVRDLVVTERLRGQGIGSRLLVRTERELADAGISEYRLNIVAGNTSAQRFYERHGLTSVSQVMLGRARRDG